ncbi:MAG: PAS domain-containing protein, partial [Halanaerobiales bacterium]
MQLDMKKYKLILEAAPNLIWVSGKDGRCYFFNQTWLEFRGRTLQEEQGKGWIEGVHPEDRERCVDIYMEHFQDRKPFRMTYRLLRKDGEYRWIDDTGVPFYDDEGEFLGFVGSCVDVTDKIKGAQYRKRAVTDGLTDIMNRQHFFEK